MKRLPLIALVVAAGFASGCANIEENKKEGETEGIYVTAGGLKYQVQASRQLNPSDAEDRSYLLGLSERETDLEARRADCLRTAAPQAEQEAAQPGGTGVGAPEVTCDEVLFAVFLRVENEGEKPHQMADGFKIVDTQEKEYEPLVMDAAKNPFAYQRAELSGDSISPDPDSLAYQGPTQGQVLVFRLTVDSLANRPLEFEIEDPEGGEPAKVNLDV